MAASVGMSVAGEGRVQDETEVDSRVAAILHLQQLQHKQEVMQLLEAHPVTNADTEFRMQLDELVRDHLTTCMALASCSSTHDVGTAPFSSFCQDSESQIHHLLDLSPDKCHHHHHHHHRYHLVVESEEDSENDKENVHQRRLSTDNSSGSSVPIALAKPQSRISGRWDARQGTEPTVRERQVREAELLALAGLHTVSTLDASFLQDSPRPKSESSVQRPQRLSSLFQMWRELEGEQGVGRDRMQPPERTRSRAAESETLMAQSDASLQQSNQQQSALPETEVGESPSVHALDSADVQEIVTSEGQDPIQEMDGERERVRQLVSRWMRDSGVTQTEGRSDEQSISRTEWLHLGERDRVRELAREWVRASNCEGPRERQGNLAGSSPRQIGELPQTHHNRIIRDAHTQGQMLLEMLLRTEQERQRELEGLSEHHAVSEFAHRNRLQSLLRGRFLRNGNSIAEHPSPSLADGEIGQLRQRRAVSGLREGFRFRLETIVHGQVNTGSSEAQRERQPNQPVVSVANSTHERDRFVESLRSEWHEVAEAGRASELQSLEDATAYNMELRELLGRRSVTNMLASEFRDRLDQLIRSFLRSQGRTPQPWNVVRPQPPSSTPQQQEGSIQQAQAEELEIGSQPQATRHVVPHPPPSRPLQPLWQQEPQQANLQHPALMEWSSLSSELRSDMSVLQEGLVELRQMMQQCMEMQLELKRSIRQEVSGALQRIYVDKAVPQEALDGTKWALVKKGVCSICCDKQIDSLLYRCGHMCTCLKCANELLQNKSSCPMCRASIVEVVRAFTVS